MQDIDGPYNRRDGRSTTSGKQIRRSREILIGTRMAKPPVAPLGTWLVHGIIKGHLETSRVLPDSSVFSLHPDSWHQGRETMSSVMTRFALAACNKLCVPLR